MLEKQRKAICKFTQGLKATSSQHKYQIMEDNQRQVLTFVAANKQQDETETDQMTKAIKIMISDELQKVMFTFISGVLFMME